MMRQSLAVAAGCGQSTESISDQKRRLLTEGSIEDLLALSASLYGFARMEAADDADDDTDDTDDDAEDDGADDDDDDDDDADAGDKGDDPKDIRIVELSAEAKKKRLRIKAQAREIADLKAKLAQQGKQGKDDDADTGDAKDEPNPLEQENQALKERLATQSLRSEFTSLTTGTTAKIQFQNPKTAFKLLDLSEVEIDEDGEIDGLEDAIAALAKSDPYLLVGKDDDGKGTKAPRRVGQPTGSRGKGANPNREKLLKKYPALRR